MGKVYVKNNVKNFSINQIAESGQAFRWEQINESKCIGVVNDDILIVNQHGDKIEIESKTGKTSFEEIEQYFDLNRNYEEIIKELEGKDESLNNAVSYGNGIRILNQDLWEMIISFIISGNNNIPRIKKSIDLISRKFGNYIGSIEENNYYSFPTISELSCASLDELRSCGVGYRDKYIYNTVKMINEGQVNMNEVPEMDLLSARNELKKLSGVGDKVADCILLFSCQQVGAFPVDTWVKKILKEYYNFEKNNISEINRFANEYFGACCGIAQQYLFYYIRNTK